MTLTQPDDTQPRARVRLRTWVREQLQDAHEVALTDLADRALAYVLATPWLLQAVVAQLLRPLIYEEVRSVAAQTRDQTIRDDTVVSAQERRQPSYRRSIWASWLEHADERHVLVLDMTADDLRAAEAERRARGRGEYDLADLWATLRSRLTTPEQRVGQVWTVAEIEAAQLQIQQTSPDAPLLVPVLARGS